MGNCSSLASPAVQNDDDTRKNMVTIDETLQSNGCSRLTSMYSQKGSKGINQDSAVIYEGFGTKEKSFFGVFDGHGKDGHIVSKFVRNRLPGLILSQQDAFVQETHGEACVSAFKAMDKEIKLQENLDCTWSGTTAVTIIMQGEDLIVSNLGDSRAILGTISDNDELIAVQLTNDLKPNLPDEAERILKCNGRIHALEWEPSLQRVWLPKVDIPGLAMTRCFGDFGIKSFGIIATPQISYHHITNKDHFLVLATDGVWDVLTNEQVAGIVWAVTTEEKAAKAVADAAVSAWKHKYPSSKMDDCTVVCVFLQESRPSQHVIFAAATTSPT